MKLPLSLQDAQRPLAYNVFAARHPYVVNGAGLRFSNLACATPTALALDVAVHDELTGQVYRRSDLLAVLAKLPRMEDRTEPQPTPSGEQRSDTAL